MAHHLSIQANGHLMNRSSADLHLNNAAQTQAWLERHQNKEAEQFLELVIGVAQELTMQPRPLYSHIAVLETLRPKVHEAISALLSEISFRPVPLQVEESKKVRDLLECMSALRNAYACIYPAAPTEVVNLPTLLPGNSQRDSVLHDRRVTFASQQEPISARLLIIYRTLKCVAYGIELAYRARISLLQQEWDLLIRYVRLAASDKLIETPLIDPLDPLVQLNLRQVVVVTVLLRLAQPETLPLISFDATLDLARRFSKTVKFRLDEGEACLQPSPWPSFAITSFMTIRLDTRTLTAELKRLNDELMSGNNAPEWLGLDKRLSRGSAHALAKHLLACWRSPAQATSSWRKPLDESAQVIASFHNISGNLNRLGSTTETVSIGRSIYDYQRYEDDKVSISKTKTGSIDQIKTVLAQGELWHVEGENSTGFLLTRRSNNLRLQLDQLALLATHYDSERPSFFVGHVESLRQNLVAPDAPLALQEIGIRLLRGTPTLISVRLPNSVFETSLMLRTPPLGATQKLLEFSELNFQQSSLILPPGRHQEGSITELLMDGVLQRIKIGKLLFRGQDFDQMTFSLL